MAAIIWIYTHRKTIMVTFSVIFFFVLWFTIERQADRIAAQNAEIKALNAEIAQIRAEYRQIREDTAAVAAFLTRLEGIENQHKTEVKKNEACVADYDPDSFIERLNELFGYCAGDREAGDQTVALPGAR